MFKLSVSYRLISVPAIFLLDPASLRFLLRNTAQCSIISPSRFPLSLLPPPAHRPPPFLLGSHPLSPSIKIPFVLTGESALTKTDLTNSICLYIF